MIFVVATFALVLLIILGAYWGFVLRPEGEVEAHLRKRLKSYMSGRTARVDVLKAPERLSQLNALHKLLARRGAFTSPLNRLIQQSGVRTTVGTILLMSGCCGVLGYAVAKHFTGQPLFGLLAGALLAVAPFFFLRWARSRRFIAFEEQFPEAIDLIGRALRAGHAFTTGLAMVAEEIPKPVGTEFKLLYDQQNYGAPMPEALAAFSERVPILDARFFVTAVLTHREAGGNLAEVLDNLASIIRDRFRVKRQVRVLTAHARLSGFILAGLPPALACVFVSISPAKFKMLFSDPLGMQMVGAAVTLQVVGTLIIRKIVNIEY